jgi:hypothetical protein
VFDTHDDKGYDHALPATHPRIGLQHRLR